MINGNLINVNNGNGVDSDPDGDAITVSMVDGLASNLAVAVTGSNGGTFVVQPNGAYSFDTGNDFDNLAVGEIRDTEITYTITDNEGGESTATVIVTVTGTNDDPNTIGTIPGQIDTDSVTITDVDITPYFGDVDATDTITFDDNGSLPPGLSIDSVTGVITGTPTADASNGGPYTVTITANDSNGGSVTQTFNWTINNPAPVATDDNFATTQGGTLSGNVVNEDNGNGVDIDLSLIHI